MKRYFIFLLAIASLAGCETDIDIAPETEKQEKAVYLTFAPLANVVVRAADNLPEEFAIKNLSVFLAEVGSNTIIERYPNIGFTPADPNPVGDTLNHKLITLPLDPSTIGRKDVYVVANHSGAALPTITTVSQLKAIQTSAANAVAGLSTANGLPMFGELLNANLSGTSREAAAVIPLTRVCAKFRVTLTFVDAAYAGTGNSFTMIDVPTHTFYGGSGAGAVGLITYPATTLSAVGALQYQGVAYVFESMTVPTISVNTTINSEAKTYLINTSLPVSSRNNLYDIDVRIYRPVSPRSASAVNREKPICKVAIYVDGVLLEEYFVDG
jgi:hypothetical protein